MCLSLSISGTAKAASATKARRDLRQLREGEDDIIRHDKRHVFVCEKAKEPAPKTLKQKASRSKIIVLLALELGCTYLSCLHGKS